MKRTFTFLLLISCSYSFAQKLDKLTVEKIMRDPVWMGTSPSGINWSNDSKKIYFDWNPEKAEHDVLYAINPTDPKPEKVGLEERREMLPTAGPWNKAHTVKLYEKNGDIWFFDLKTGKSTALTNTTDRESNPAFSADETKILFMRGDNLFAMKLNGGELIQLTNFTRAAAGGAATPPPTGGGGGGGRRGGGGGALAATIAPQTRQRGPQPENAADMQAKWLKNEQSELFDIIKKKDKETKYDAAELKEMLPKRLKEIAVDDKQVGNVQLSPDGRYITYRLTKQAQGTRTNVPSYVTASGYTEDIPNRTKVGAPQSTSEAFVFDTKRDTVYTISTKTLPGIKDIPEYFKDYPQELEARKARNEDRVVNVGGVSWSQDGKYAVVAVSAEDYKDRWIMKLDAETGKLSLLDRQHDDAWIGGPGINGFGGGLGWIDNQHIYFQSEASGYSHIYTEDVATAEKRQLTTGNFEVSALKLSTDKKDFYFSANVEHPGIYHFYKMPVTGGVPVKLTSMKGGNEVELSPDEKWLAIRYSYSNKPWELYIQPNKAGAKAVQITHSTTEEFNSYPWRDPEMITFKNRFGADVYARVYPAKNPDPAKPAVVFVHGAGYLQNVDYRWSSYSHEYMFNNLLADNGYTVMDIDYTGSAGYGRDFRTGIYRHMGGKDLTDQVDGVKLLVDKYGVNPAHVGLYGGSYGGFITLMAMFTTPDVFAAGAGLRSVTDWAHYNHGYTANILNEPYNDEKAYKLSSPIYFADGLKGRLLMCHGMVDQNVNFQDIVRLSQRLIELHKKNWELAVFPVEDHGFVEPSSWTDEYSRIYKLFEETLKKTN